MALGGFIRMLKIEGDVVTDHRPVPHPDTETGVWVEVMIPAGIPLDLNSLISVEALIWDGNSLSWGGYGAKIETRKRKVKRRAALDSAADMDTRRIRLEALGRPGAAIRTARERDRLLVEAGDEDS